MSKLRSPRLIIFAMIALLIIGGIYRLQGFFGGSSTGTVTTPAATTQPEAASVSREAVSDRYASFTHVSTLVESPVDKPVPPVLANHSFVSSQFGAWQLSVQITDLPTGQLSDAGTYIFRTSKPTQFVKTQRQFAGRSLTVFTDKTAVTFDQTVYFQQGSRAVSIALFGGTPDQSEAMQAELDAVISSWEWR